MRALCGPHQQQAQERGLLFLLVDSSLQAFGLSANNNSSGTLYNSALRNLLGDRSPTGQAREGSVFRAGDLKMINDFSQAELCPPPPSLPPSLTSFFAGGGGWRKDGAGCGCSKAKLTDHEENAGMRALCYKGKGVLLCFIFIFISFYKNSNADSVF